METQAIPPLSFLGRWSLARTIRESGGVATLEGEVNLSQKEGGMLYREAGVLTLANGSSLEARQSYLWEIVGSNIEVLFSDGRAFHSFEPGVTRDVHHDCAPDLYQGCYDWSAWPQWRLTWQVTGPRKSYHSESIFTRL